MQRFTLSGILWIVYCCHLVLFYLWYHRTFEFCNLSCDIVCEAWIAWIMIDCRNLRLIIASNALWCAHVSPIYRTFFHLKLQRSTFNGIMRIVCCCHLVLFYLWHHHTSAIYDLSWNIMCDVWIGWTMSDGCNLCLIVASNALWHAHVLPIYWTFSHLKLQRFILSGILQIVCCCHLALFYLWYHCTLGFCNLFCDVVCEVCIGWIMINCCNLRLIVANNALWCAHVSSIYWTFSHLKLRIFTFNGILQII